MAGRDDPLDAGQTFKDRASVGIVMPARNPEPAYLKDALASIIDQTYAYWRAFVVDDGSEDSLDWAARLDDRITVLRQDASGVSAARNHAIRAITDAQIPYVALLDADDLWEPTKLERQVEFLERFPDVAVLASPFDHIDQRGEYLSPGFDADDGTYETLLRGNSRHTSSLLIRRRALDALTLLRPEGPFRTDLVAYEDNELLLAIAEHRFGRIMTLAGESPLSHYRFNTGGTSASKYRRARLDYEKLLEEHIGRALAGGNMDAARIARASIRDTRGYFGGRAFDAARSAFKQRSFVATVPHLVYALRFAPRKSLSQLRQYRPSLRQ